MTLRNFVKFIFLVSVNFSFKTLSATVFGQPEIYEPFCVIISEIMADPTPVQSLPDEEYIELFNRSSEGVNLSGWKITAGKRTHILPDTLLLPAEYLAVGMKPVTNTGQTITLRTKFDQVIHSVSFTDNWYNNKEKDDGGWSLEMIDTGNPCGGRSNWQASSDLSGGTPGRKNSSARINPDRQAPFIMHATMCTDTAVLLHFNEPLYYTDAYKSHLFSVDQGFYHPESAHPVEPFFTDIILKYSVPFKPGIIYRVTVLKELKDCAGNHPDDGLFARFAETEPAELLDLVINEVLFEAGNRIEYVEIYNRSNKVIDLATIKLAIGGENNVIEKSIRITENPASLFPDEYRVICRNSDILASNFAGMNPVTIIECDNLFALPDAGALLILQDTTGQVIDECYYNREKHHPMLTSTAGISLERISTEKSSGDPSNWHSASYASGFGTPGKKNSQHKTENDEVFALSSEIISPDGDGIDDEVNFSIYLSEPGWTGDITIFNLNGQKIRTIVSNKLTGTGEVFKWNGCSDNGDVVAPGTYLVYAAFFNSKGEIKKVKKVISVVKK